MRICPECFETTTWKTPPCFCPWFPDHTPQSIKKVNYQVGINNIDQEINTNLRKRKRKIPSSYVFNIYIYHARIIYPAVKHFYGLWSTRSRTVLSLYTHEWMRFGISIDTNMRSIRSHNKLNVCTEYTEEVSSFWPREPGNLLARFWPESTASNMFASGTAVLLWQTKDKPINPVQLETNMCRWSPGLHEHEICLKEKLHDAYARTILYYCILLLLYEVFLIGYVLFLVCMFLFLSISFKYLLLHIYFLF